MRLFLRPLAVSTGATLFKAVVVPTKNSSQAHTHSSAKTPAAEHSCVSILSKTLKQQAQTAPKLLPASQTGSVPG